MRYDWRFISETGEKIYYFCPQGSRCFYSKVNKHEYKYMYPNLCSFFEWFRCSFGQSLKVEPSCRLKSSPDRWRWPDSEDWPPPWGCAPMGRGQGETPQHEMDWDHTSKYPGPGTGPGWLVWAEKKGWEQKSLGGQLPLVRGISARHVNTSTMPTNTPVMLTHTRTLLTFNHTSIQFIPRKLWRCRRTLHTAIAIRTEATEHACLIPQTTQITTMILAQDQTMGIILLLNRHTIPQ